MSDPCRNLGQALRQENGGGFGFVCIWRTGDTGDSSRRMSVETFLSQPENFGGEWRIDGGWGGPPGPIVVRWDDANERWINGGFCGRNLPPLQEGSN